VRLSVSLVAVLMFFASAAVSHGVEDTDDSFGLRTEQSCYNYTFIDNNSIRGTLLEKEEMDSSAGKPHEVSYDTVRNLCKPDSAFQLAAFEKADTPDTNNGDSEGVSEGPILLNSRVKFIEEGKLDYEQFQSKETIFYGGLVPFVAVHDADLETDDHFFNPESFSLFLYFKRKF
jgi:hypothetical protein